ncbi:Vgb family protein [Actinoplanes xinjiangensis]|uniref:Streptogramin lyase n=2 Tax=Actinoplanes xinjiangensis TaxID=512350 RepID=A0A316FFA4_9ACTN|nr:streptogramin lyase [Actinoplanes xinjiangensis]GIF40203.1 hypothetical protein Axi01nite_45140 [Actinoplanes xinjiangensis]
MTEVTLPQGWAPYAVAGDPDGTLWTTILDPPGLARITPDGVVRHGPFDGRPMLVAVAADGAVWCTRGDDRLVRRDADGTYTVIETPAGSAPYGIAAAGNGGVWFTAPGQNRIGRATAAGDLSMIDLPIPDARAAMITAAPDGSAWAALNGAGALARVFGDAVEIVELPGGRAPAAPVGVSAGNAGVWYADIAGGCVGLVEPSGAVRQVVFDDPACRPHAVAADPDGGCWVTLWGSGELARVTADGDVRLHRLPGEEPHGLWVANHAATAEPVGSRAGDATAGLVGSRAGDAAAGLVGSRAGEGTAGPVGSRVGDAAAGLVGSRVDEGTAGPVGSRAGDATAGPVGSRAGDAKVEPVSFRPGSAAGDVVWVAMESGSLVAVDRRAAA